MSVAAHLLLLQVDDDLWRPQRHLLHKVQVLVPAPAEENC